MLIVSRVCADFFDDNNNIVFSIKPKDLGNFISAPDDLLKNYFFQDMVSDGSISIPDEVGKKKMENDPYAGIDPDGKAEKKESSKRGRKSSSDKNVESDKDSEAVEIS